MARSKSRRRPAPSSSPTTQKKTDRDDSPSGTDSAGAVRPDDSAATPETWIAPPPSASVKRIAFALAAFHLTALFLSYSAIVEPSSVHSRLLSFIAPYIRSTHFAADGRPYYLAHGTEDEQPHRLQIADLTPDNAPIDGQTKWQTVDPQGIPGLASSDRYSRWMTLVGTLARSDQPSLAASLLLPLLQGESNVDAIRIVRLPTELTSGEQDANPTVYVARVVQDEGDALRLVSIQSRRLTTYPRETEGGVSEGDQP